MWALHSWSQSYFVSFTLYSGPVVCTYLNPLLIDGCFPNPLHRQVPIKLAQMRRVTIHLDSRRSQFSLVPMAKIGTDKDTAIANTISV